jgi:dTDP-4-dehydrorhamnose reductase
MIGIFGSGQVAQHIAEYLDLLGIKYQIVGRGAKETVPVHRKVDIKFPVDTAKPQELKVIAKQFEVVIYTSAYRDLLACEASYAVADRINHLIPRVLSTHVPMLYISTDYVFGKLNPEWPRPIAGKIGEGEDPESRYFSSGSKSVYGKTKRSGELGVLAHDGWVARIASPFGKWRSPLRESFVDIMGSKGGDVILPSQQIITPTYLPESVRLMVGLFVDRKDSGIYHAVNEGSVSYADLVRQIRRERGIAGKVTNREDNRDDELRPNYSALQNNKLDKLSHWAEAVRTHFEGY